MSKDNVSDQEFIPEQESLRTKPSDIESDPAAGRLEDILPDIINNIPAPVVVKDQNLRVVFVNNTAGRVMGRPVGEIKGATSFGLIPEEQARLFEEKDRLVLSTGQTQTYEEPIPFGDEVYTVLATKSRYSDRATGKHYVVGVYQDITRRKRMDEKLRRIREEQSVLLRMVPAMIFWIDNEGVFIRVNEAFARAFQKSQDDICGKSLFDLYPEDMARKFHNDNMGIIESGTPQKGIEEPVWTPGGTIWVITDKMPYRDESEDVVGIVGFSVDITERKRLEEALGESEERYRAVADFTYDCEIWFGPDKEMLHVSPSSERITGYPREKFMEGLDFIERIIHKDDIPLWERHMSGISGEEDEFVEFRILHADGRIRWLSQVSRRVSGPDGATLGVRCSMRDITSRKAMEKQLRHQALHDPLTGLANRTLCLDRIQRTLERSKRRNYHYAVAFVDLDRFKVINDSFGHAYGDKLLLKVAERLAGCVRGLDTVSRFGGDEFILILDELESSKEGLGIVKRVLDDLRRPFFIEGREVRTSSSIGMVLSPSIHENPEDLLRNANIAMYRAKGSGRDRVKVFNTRMLEQAIQVMTVENDLRRAIAE
ncbi:MAG: PAS domain S-box protein [Thermodesulfobacteriota bacterium]|nr:PAS domain S-box protein [Thermodesulfobacteriota bacterium]